MPSNRKYCTNTDEILNLEAIRIISTLCDFYNFSLRQIGFNCQLMLLDVEKCMPLHFSFNFQFRQVYTNV